MAGSVLYLNVYEDAEGRLYSLEQDPIPHHRSAARAAFLEQDGFWADYRFTLKIQGQSVSYVNIAEECGAKAPLDSVGDTEGILSEQVLWRLQLASSHYRAPQENHQVPE